MSEGLEEEVRQLRKQVVSLERVVIQLMVNARLDNHTHRNACPCAACVFDNTWNIVKKMSEGPDEPLMRAFYYAKRMQLPSPMILATGLALLDYLHNKWRVRSHIYARDDDVAPLQMLETCKACLVAYDAEFAAHVKLLVTRAPPDVRRQCMVVYMLLRLGPFRGNKDVCWLIMAHVFASGSSDAFETAVSIVTKYPTSVKMVGGIWSKDGINRWVHENIKPRGPI